MERQSLLGTVVDRIDYTRTRLWFYFHIEYFWLENNFLMHTPRVLFAVIIPFSLNRRTRVLFPWVWRSPTFLYFFFGCPFGHLDLTLYAPILPILFSFINEFIPLSSFVRSVIHCPSATGLAINAALVPPIT